MRGFYGVSREFKGRLKKVSIMFQESFRSQLRVFQGCFRSFLSGFEAISRRVSRPVKVKVGFKEAPWGYKILSRVFQ